MNLLHNPSKSDFSPAMGANAKVETIITAKM